MQKIKALSRDTFSSLAIKNYRLYFIGQAVSMSGTWMQIVSLGYLILTLGGTGTTLGTVLALHFLPVLFLGAYGGVVVDRFSKRRIIFITQVLLSFAGLTLGILLWLDMMQLWMVYVFACINGLISTLDNPARQTFVMEMVGEKQLRNAVSINSLLSNSARIIGPALAGVFIATVGLAMCFIFNGLSYLAVVIALLFMDAAKLHPTKRMTRMKGKLREGFVYVKRTPVIWGTIIIAAIIGTFSIEFIVTLPLLAKVTFQDTTANSYVMLSSAMGVGAVIGALYSATKKKATTRALIINTMLFGLSMLLLALTPHILSAITVMLFVGAFSIIVLTLLNTILQLASLPEMRGRVMSFYTIAIFGSTPIGAPIIGWISEVLGPRWGIGIGGGAAFVAGLLGLFFLKKHYKQKTIQPTIETLIAEQVQKA